jgi:hypothetical protein
MPREIINIGSVANDGTGDPLRECWIKVNTMTSEIYTALGDGTTLSGANLVSAIDAEIGNSNWQTSGVLPAQDDGVEIVAAPTALNFTGTGVTVTDVGGVATIDIPSGGAVDVLSNVATSTIVGRVTAGSGDSEELTPAQVRTLLNVEDGATADQTAAEIVTAIDNELGSSVWQTGGASLPFQDDGSPIIAAPSAVNFTGAGVTVTDVGGVATIDIPSGGTVDVVSNVATDTILGRTTAGSGDSEELTPAQVRTLLNVEDGATADQTGAEIVSAIDTELGGSTWQSGGGSVPVEDDGSQIVAAPTALNFTGAGITVTDVGGVATIDVPGGGGGTVDVVSNVAQDVLLGRISTGSGDSEELTPIQVRGLLDVPEIPGEDPQNWDIASFGGVVQADLRATKANVVTANADRLITEVTAFLGNPGGSLDVVCTIAVLSGTGFPQSVTQILGTSNTVTVSAAGNYDFIFDVPVEVNTGQVIGLMLTRIDGTPTDRLDVVSENPGNADPEGNFTWNAAWRSADNSVTIGIDNDFDETDAINMNITTESTTLETIHWFTDTEKTKLEGIEDGADVSPVTSVAGEVGVISAANLRTAINVEDGATADQTGAEIVTAIDTELGGSTWQSGGGSVPVQDDGSQIVAAPTALNFTGTGVTVTDVGGVATIDIPSLGGGGTVDVVSNVATSTILGRTTAGSGDSEELTPADVRTLLNVEDGATADQTGAEIVTAIDTELGSSVWQTKQSSVDSLQLVVDDTTGSATPADPLVDPFDTFQNAIQWASDNYSLVDTLAVLCYPGSGTYSLAANYIVPSNIKALTLNAYGYATTLDMAGFSLITNRQQSLSIIDGWTVNNIPTMTMHGGGFFDVTLNFNNNARLTIDLASEASDNGYEFTLESTTFNFTRTLNGAGVPGDLRLWGNGNVWFNIVTVNYSTSGTGAEPTDFGWIMVENGCKAILNANDNITLTDNAAANVGFMLARNGGTIVDEGATFVGDAYYAVVDTAIPALADIKGPTSPSGTNAVFNVSNATTMSSSAFATKGNIFSVQNERYLIGADFDTDGTTPSQTVDLFVAELDDVQPGTISRILVDVGEVSEVDPANGTRFLVPQPIRLQPGKHYAIAWVRTDGTGTSVLGVISAASAALTNANLRAEGSIIENSNAPAIGDALFSARSANEHFGMGIVTQGVVDGVSLDSLTDVNTSGATTGQVLKRQGDGTYAFENDSTGAGAIPVEDDGVQIVASPTAINFTGNGVTVTDNTGVATVDIPSGGLPAWSIQTANVTASAGDRILANTSGGAFTVTLPATPTTGDEVWFADIGSNWNTNNLTVDGNGANVDGAATFTADTNEGSFITIFDGTNWIVRFVGVV